MPDGDVPGDPADGSEPAAAGRPTPGDAPGTPAAPSAPTPAAVPTKSTREIAHEALRAAGLTKPPKSSQGPRRLVLFSLVVLAVLVVLVVGSLVALGHLKTTVTLPPSTTTTLPTTTTSSSTSTTIPPTGGATAGLAPLAAYGAGSTNAVVLTAVGAGGEPLPFVRTTAHTYITDPSAAPVLVYWWNGTCAPCAAENLVVVSSLEALGGKFTGLSTTTETGGVATISLRHATYHGPVVLQASEVDGPNGLPDQSYTPQAQQQFQTYDRKPYTKDPAAYPFLDIGGHFVQVGPAFASALLDRLTIAQIAADLSTPDSAVTRAIDGSADELTAAVCTTLKELSQRRPLICANPSIVAIEPGLPTTPPK